MESVCSHMEVQVSATGLLNCIQDGLLWKAIVIDVTQSQDIRMVTLPKFQPLDAKIINRTKLKSL